MIDGIPHSVSDIPRVAKPLPPYVCPMASNLQAFKWFCVILPTLILMAIFTALMILMPKRHNPTVGVVLYAPDHKPDPPKQGGVIDGEYELDNKDYPRIRVINCGDHKC